MAKKIMLKDFPPADRQKAYEWFSKQKDSLPAEVQILFEHYQAIENELKNSDKKKNFILSELRRAMGYAPSSERKKPGRSQKTQEDKRNKLNDDLNYSRSRIKWHKLHLKRHKSMEKNIQKEIKSIDDIVLSAEIEKEIDLETDKEMEILVQGGEANDSFSTPKETLMTGLEAQIEEKELTLPLPEEPSGEKYTLAFCDERIRYDLSFNLTRLFINVEKGHDSCGNLVSSSTHILGPERFQVTWQFLANLTLLATQYAMPFERLARLMSSQDKKFSSSQIWRMFYYVAQRLSTIYLQLAENLSKATLLSGDDTSVRVVECARAIEKKERPWEDFANREKAQQKLSKGDDDLEYKLAAKLGFEFPKKGGLGPKIKFNTSLIWGKPEVDSKSHIIFYRSHFGGFGDLLTTIIQNCPLEKKDLFIQSDLSTVNLISDEELLQKFHVTQFGCAAHARRPFALYEKDDRTCSAILASFGRIYHLEKELDTFGRNEYKVREIRKLAIECWEFIKECAQKIEGRWSKDTPLGEGARYILRHYETLTRYINYPHVPLTNDLSERMLRMEKLIQVNSLFRNTLKGRFALDISRTIVQTAIAADINVKEYLMHVLMQPETTNPKLLTPYAYSKCPPNEIDDPC